MVMSVCADRYVDCYRIEVCFGGWATLFYCYEIGEDRPSTLEEAEGYLAYHRGRYDWRCG